MLLELPNIYHFGKNVSVETLEVKFFNYNVFLLES